MTAVSWWEEEPLNDDQPVQLSMLRHYAYCPKSCALIHIEQCFEENVFTLKGREGHERADEPVTEYKDGLRIEHGLPLFNRRLNLTGKADIVEFPSGVPYPVEYKHGARSVKAHAEVQLCAQVLCLEEMFDQEVPKGALYALTTHRRTEVVVTAALRDRTLKLLVEVRALLRSNIMPPAVNDRRCPNCSLIEICQPALLMEEHRAQLMSEWLNSQKPAKEP